MGNAKNPAGWPGFPRVLQLRLLPLYAPGGGQGYGAGG